MAASTPGEQAIPITPSFDYLLHEVAAGTQEIDDTRTALGKAREQAADLNYRWTDLLSNQDTRFAAAYNAIVDGQASGELSGDEAVERAARLAEASEGERLAEALEQAKDARDKLKPGGLVLFGGSLVLHRLASAAPEDKDFATIVIGKEPTASQKYVTPRIQIDTWKQTETGIEPLTCYPGTHVTDREEIVRRLTDDLQYLHTYTGDDLVKRAHNLEHAFTVLGHESSAARCAGYIVSETCELIEYGPHYKPDDMADKLIYLADHAPEKFEKVIEEVVRGFANSDHGATRNEALALGLAEVQRLRPDIALPPVKDALFTYATACHDLREARLEIIRREQNAVQQAAQDS